MADLEKIAEELSNLTVLEASELSKILEEKWGVSAAAPVAVAAAPGGDAGGAAAEEKDSFTIVLTDNVFLHLCAFISSVLIFNSIVYLILIF